MRAECVLLKFSGYYSDTVGESLKFVQKGKKREGIKREHYKTITQIP